MKPRYVALSALALLLAPAAPGSQPVRDLGQGLAYYRVHELPEDQPNRIAAHPGPCVLDLRYAKADEASAATLRAWVMFNATPRTPIFVIENGATGASLRAALTGNGPVGLILLGPESAKVSPDITVSVSPADDRRGYDALEKGATLESLLTDYPDKPRIDEAYLEKEHISDSEAPEVPTDKAKANTPVDLLLQKAVQLHRGLLALKRL